MKWFSWNGIMKEAKRVRWPKGKDLLKDSIFIFDLCANSSAVKKVYEISKIVLFSFLYNFVVLIFEAPLMPLPSNISKSST